MGHMNIGENMPPREQWVGCGNHAEYNNNCFSCHLRNGGGDD